QEELEASITITAKQATVLPQKASLHESEVIFGALKQNNVSTNTASRSRRQERYRTMR
ncbi:hypothetical protein BGZ80_001393, partial [Entomortierella chlamydospora]